jgi:outer membrane protein
MKNAIVGWVGLGVALVSLGWNFVFKAPKIGYAETSVIMSDFSEAVKAKAHFQEQQKEWDKNLKTLNDSMLAAMNRMKVQYDGANKPAKDSMRKDFETRNDDYQRYVEAVRKMSQDKERELMDPVIKKINSFLEIWGREKGYSLILGTMQGGNILQADPRYNLTSRILKDLNSQYRDVAAADPVKPVGERPKAPDSSVGVKVNGK